MLLSAHIVQTGMGKALTAFRRPPDPGAVDGLRYARTYLTAELRKGMLPSLAITGVALIAAWDDDEYLDRFLYHRRARPYEDGWRVRMLPARSIGELPGLPDLPRRERPTGDLPVVAVTVGRVRANRFLRFVRAAGAAEREAAGHPGFVDGLTLLRPPLVIGTFSLWRNVRDMRQYVTGKYPGGHERAMKVDREHRLNHEMSFSRYVPYAAEGRWGASNPLDMLDCVNGSDSTTGPLSPMDTSNGV
ncbi:hypothetical protein E1293_04565 [Actinomadura darangshiensis]|uniref:Spheroidene monooxygenase n=1 Tax=Actinomadura darangshiensis TaxID=705336 RepID=A0A4R5BZ27_9ACTN|nr:hypothetical protein [Actinomadura darangshiensis]TDD89632.1 hypothetical protein E1293_04565 [Actinomadura darangshiensis]